MKKQTKSLKKFTKSQIEDAINRTYEKVVKSFEELPLASDKGYQNKVKTVIKLWFSSDDLNVVKEKIITLMNSYKSSPVDLANLVAATNHICWWLYSEFQRTNKLSAENSSKFFADMYYKIDEFADKVLKDEDYSVYYKITD